MWSVKETKQLIVVAVAVVSIGVVVALAISYDTYLAAIYAQSCS